VWSRCPTHCFYFISSRISHTTHTTTSKRRVEKGSRRRFFFNSSYHITLTTKVFCSQIHPFIDWPMLSAMWVGALRFGLYKILLTSSRLCTNQSSFHSSGPPVLPTLVQYYCTATGQYTTLHLTPLCMPCIIQYWQLQNRVKAKAQT